MANYEALKTLLNQQLEARKEYRGMMKLDVGTEHQIISAFQFTDKLYGLKNCFETEDFILTTADKHGFTKDQIKTLTSFKRTANKTLFWKGTDQSVLAKLNSKPVKKQTEIEENVSHEIVAAKMIKTQRGMSMLVETTDFKLFVNHTGNLTDEQASTFVGQYFYVEDKKLQFA